MDILIYFLVIMFIIALIVIPCFLPSPFSELEKIQKLLNKPPPKLGDVYTKRQYYRDRLLEIPDQDLLTVDPYTTKLFLKLAYQILWDALGKNLDKGINEDD